MSFRKTFLLAGGFAVALLASVGTGFANEEIEKSAKNANLWPAPGRR